MSSGVEVSATGIICADMKSCKVMVGWGQSPTMGDHLGSQCAVGSFLLLYSVGRSSLNMDKSIVCHKTGMLARPFQSFDILCYFFVWQILSPTYFFPEGFSNVSRPVWGPVTPRPLQVKSSSSFQFKGPVMGHMLKNCGHLPALGYQVRGGGHSSCIGDCLGTPVLLALLFVVFGGPQFT